MLPIRSDSNQSQGVCCWRSSLSASGMWQMWLHRVSCLRFTAHMREEEPHFPPPFLAELCRMHRRYGRGEAHGIRGLWLVGVRAQHDPGTALSSLPCCPPVPTPLRCVCFGGGPISRPSLLSTTWVFQSWTGCLSGRRRPGWRDSHCAAENQPTGSEWVMQARRLTNVHTGTEENAD